MELIETQQVFDFIASLSPFAFGGVVLSLIPSLIGYVIAELLNMTKSGL